MKLIVIFPFLLFLTCCALNASQEKELNDSLAGYLFGRNECQLVSYVAFSYPELVEAYKNQSDSVFKEKFNCNKDSIYLHDAILRQTVKEKNTIHVLYELTVIDKMSSQPMDKKHELIAISENGGKSWFFIDRKDYVDKTLLPNFKRLIIN